jgi:acyl-CoA synthetase (AMP-forming)/AMP-acid ligase II
MTLAADGSPQPITGEFANLVELFDAVVATDGDREAFVDSGRRMTFREWADAGDRVAGWLHEQGVVKGDVVGIRLSSSIEYAIAYQGAIRIGAIASGMNPRLGPSETD